MVGAMTQYGSRFLGAFSRVSGWFNRLLGRGFKVNNIVTEIIDTITEWIEGFWSLILMTINQAVSIFYTLPVGENPGGLTVMGVLALFGLGVGLVLYGIGFVTRMFKK